jgi:predicted DNA-binding antitoxin AbrB/MazE fold protein
MGWLKSILSIFSSLFKVLDKTTLTYGEKVDKIERSKKEQVKDDWKKTQNEIDRAFERAKSRNKLPDDK